MIQVFWSGSQTFVANLNLSRLFWRPVYYIFWKIPVSSFILISFSIYLALTITTSMRHFIVKLSFTKYLNLHWFYIYRNFGVNVKFTGLKLQRVVSQLGKFAKHKKTSY